MTFGALGSGFGRLGRLGLLAGGGGRPAPLLDGKTTGLTGAWSSHQKLLSAYAGPARRLRRSSDDTLADIGFTGAGRLDEAAVAAHIGGGSGFDRTLYDQSGAGRDLVQATSARQPLYLTAGPQSRPGADFDGVTGSNGDSIRSTATHADFFNNNSGYIAIAVLIDSISTDSSTPYSNDYIVGDDSGQYGLVARQTGPVVQAYNYDGSDDVATGTIATGQVHILEWRHEGGVVYCRVDGANETSTASGNNTGLTGVLAVGQAIVGTGPAANMKVFDLIAYDVPPNLATRDAIVAGLLAALI